jgi:hypothetical protein
MQPARDEVHYGHVFLTAKAVLAPVNDDHDVAGAPNGDRNQEFDTASDGFELASVSIIDGAMSEGLVDGAPCVRCTKLVRSVQCR